MKITSALLTLLCITATNAHAAARSWTGVAFTDNWSEGFNWGPLGSPQPGDKLVLFANDNNGGLSGGIITTNNLSDLRLHSISVGGYGSFGPSFAAIRGNSLTVSNGIANLSGVGSVGCEVVLGQGQTFSGGYFNDGNPTLSFGGGIRLNNFNLTFNVVNSFDNSIPISVSSAISGTGGVAKIGPGALIFQGSSANAYTGATTVNEGALLLNKTAYNGAIVGPLVIGDGIGGANADKVYVSRVRQIGNTVPVTINSSGLLDIVAGKSDAFGTLSGSGNILFEGSNDLEVGLDNGSSTFSGVISGDGNFWKHGTGTMILSGNNTYTGLTIVEGGGELIVNGSQPSSAVIVSNVATLGGSGTVGSVTANNAIISPGQSSAGILNCGVLAVDSSAIVHIELNGTTPGSGHDQINCNSTVTLANAVLNATLGFASAAGNTFTIINKTTAGAISGKFSSLPENATLNVSGIPFRISYTGGNGNDIVLTQLLPPPTLTSMEVSGDNLVFSWPTNYTGFTLECNTNLTYNVWMEVSPPPVINGMNYVSTNSMTEPQKFFRLRFP